MIPASSKTANRSNWREAGDRPGGVAAVAEALRPEEMPLAGIRVLDLGRHLAGPTCAMLLGDLGADVIKVEKPGKGEDSHAAGPGRHRQASGP
jgi:hypothetical protein